MRDLLLRHSTLIPGEPINGPEYGSIQQPGYSLIWNAG